MRSLGPLPRLPSSSPACLLECLPACQPASQPSSLIACLLARCERASTHKPHAGSETQGRLERVCRSFCSLTFARLFLFPYSPNPS